MPEQLKDLVLSSSRIHIVTHLNPDYDAYASLLFMYALIQKNFPEKIITLSVETESPNQVVSFLPYFNKIVFSPIDEVLTNITPDFLVIVDAPSIKRISKKPETVTKLLEGKKVAIFDHHDIEDTNVALLENSNRYAAVEVIYSYAVANDMTLPEKWEEYYLTGFIGDSYRFYYQVPTYRESFETIATILDHGYTIREFNDKLYGFTKKDLEVFKILHNNLAYESNYALTTISWDEYHAKIESSISSPEFKKARRYFIDEIMTRTYEIDFAVLLVADDTYKDDRTYSGSIRSKLGTIDCPTIAKYLNGGGHTTGAGFTVVADSLEEAVVITKKSIQDHEIEARNVAQLSQ